MDPEQRRIAQQVHDERKRRKLTQRELGEMVGVSKNTIGNFETGKSYPQRSHINQIARVLGITLDENEEPPPSTLDEWSPDVRVALRVIGLYLESYDEADRDERIREITRSVMARRL